jgi:hypothetical protein
MGNYVELTSDILVIKSLLDSGKFDVEIDSPDGWVTVNEFVDKGEYDEYVLEIAGKTIRTNANHLYETEKYGWFSAASILSEYEKTGEKISILTDSGEYIKLDSIKKTENVIPIVDIQVDHENHRYYADGVSSHNTNTGKSLFLCDAAAGAIEAGYDVLYITLEMAEERIAERIDCNLMNVNLDDLYTMKKSEFSSKMSRLKSKIQGNLIVKEYPTSGAHAGHFKALLEELKLKKGFIPKLICIDYLNICTSQRLKGNSTANSYTIVKSIAEELRGLAVEYDVPILSATQTNKGGWNNTDVEMGDISESAGTAMTVDFMFALMRTEELDERGELMIKQLKSRYGDTNYYKRFVIGVDIAKFKLFDVDQASNVLSDSGNNEKSNQNLNKRKQKPVIMSNDIDFD